MMKKNLIVALLSIIALVFVSCEKTPVNEWSRFYGYTQADIVGHYEANPDESLYQDLPTEGVEVYNNATIDIAAASGKSISLHIVIPEVINKRFSGPVNTTEQESDLTLNNFNEDILMTVYKNAKGQVRFHGRVKHYYYNADHELVNSINYGFDVIKTSSESVAE